MASMVRTTHTTFEHANDDALLLHEFCHRTANEIAAASAAVQLARRFASGAGLRLLDAAVDRLEAFGALHRTLARPMRSHVDVSVDLTEVCRAVAEGATGAARGVFSVELPETWVGGGTARRLVLIAAELMTNAVRHALDGRAGTLEVSLDVAGDDVVLVVRDDGPGMRSDGATSGSGLGSGIVTQLVDRGRGSLSIESSRRGTTVRVAMPIDIESGEDTEIVF